MNTRDREGSLACLRAVVALTRVFAAVAAVVVVVEEGLELVVV
jgi:hypothetical protein